jgi:hypothetical protein
VLLEEVALLLQLARKSVITAQTTTTIQKRSFIVFLLPAPAMLNTQGAINAPVYGRQRRSRQLPILFFGGAEGCGAYTRTQPKANLHSQHYSKVNGRLIKAAAPVGATGTTTERLPDAELPTLANPPEWNTELLSYFGIYVPVLPVWTMSLFMSARQQSLSRSLLLSQLVHQMEDEAMVGSWSPPQSSCTDDQDSHERYSHADH